MPANLCFGGPDMKTIFFTAHTSVYSLRVKVPGLPGIPTVDKKSPWEAPRTQSFGFVGPGAGRDPSTAGRNAAKWTPACAGSGKAHTP